MNLADYKVSDVLAKDEKGTPYIVVKENLPLYEVEAKMIEQINRKGHAKLVILITPAGRIERKEDIIGIITTGDIPKIVQSL